MSGMKIIFRLESLAIQRSFISSADLAVLVDMAATLTTLDLTSCINISDGTLLSKLYSLRWVQCLAMQMPRMIVYF